MYEADQVMSKARCRHQAPRFQLRLPLIGALWLPCPSWEACNEQIESRGGARGARKGKDERQTAKDNNSSVSQPISRCKREEQPSHLAGYIFLMVDELLKASASRESLSGATVANQNNDNLAPEPRLCAIRVRWNCLHR